MCVYTCTYIMKLGSYSYLFFTRITAMLNVLCVPGAVVNILNRLSPLILQQAWAIDILFHLIGEQTVVQRIKHLPGIPIAPQLIFEYRYVGHQNLLCIPCSFIPMYPYVIKFKFSSQVLLKYHFHRILLSLLIYSRECIVNQNAILYLKINNSLRVIIGSTNMIKWKLSHNAGWHLT